MHGALTILGCVLALAVMSSGFLIPGPPKAVSGRCSRPSTSQVIRMGRGDTRTAKGKRHRHSYGKCRPRKKVVGDGAPKPAPVARRWENIEYIESEMAPLKRAMKKASMGEMEGEAMDTLAVEDAVEEMAVPEAEMSIPEAEAMATLAVEDAVEEMAMPEAEMPIPEAESMSTLAVEDAVEEESAPPIS